MLNKLRQRTSNESGFTLIELLVVMLILGILAAIAIPAFLNQKSKASDANAKVVARTMQTTMETCALDRGSLYTGCTAPVLRTIEPTIPANATAAPAATSYSVTALSSNGNRYTIARSATSVITRTCRVGTGGSYGGCLGATNTANSTGTW